MISPFAWASVALAVLLGIQTMRLQAEKTDHAETRAGHAQAIAAAEQAGREAVERQIETLQRQTAEIQEALYENAKDLEAARAAAARAGDAGQRLRDQLAIVTRSCGRASEAPPVAPGGPPADATADLLADVQRRLDEAQDRIARFADEAHAAGRACERYADAVSGS